MRKPAIFLCAIVLLLATAYFLPVAAWIEHAFAWIEANREISWLVFILMYVTATVLLMPGSILTLAGGFVFGLGYGFMLVSFASVVGAAGAFLTGRYFARGWVADKLNDLPRFAALDTAVADNGALIVLLTRLSPVFPFNLLNYAFGLTAVRFWTYVGVSWVGMIPGTVLYVYLGSIAGDLTELLAGDVGESPVGNWPLYVGLVATLLLTVVISRIATRTLREKLDEASV